MEYQQLKNASQAPIFFSTPNIFDPLFWSQFSTYNYVIFRQCGGWLELAQGCIRSTSNKRTLCEHKFLFQLQTFFTHGSGRSFPHIPTKFSENVEGGQNSFKIAYGVLATEERFARSIFFSAAKSLTHDSGRSFLRITIKLSDDVKGGQNSPGIAYKVLAI